MAELRYRIRAIILGIAGLIVALLFIRILLQLLGASTANTIVNFFFGLSEIFIQPFRNAVTLPPGTPLQILNIDALVAIGIYVLGAIALSEIITAFLYDTAEDIIQNLVDAVFKVIEFLIFIRIVLDLFAIFDRRVAAAFIQNIYNLTDWASNLINPMPIGSGSLNVSAIIVLSIVVILDIFTERFLASIFTNISGAVRRVDIKKVINVIPKPQRAAPPPPPQPQNIVINIPAPPPMPQQPANIVVNMPKQEDK